MVTRLKKVLNIMFLGSSAALILVTPIANAGVASNTPGRQCHWCGPLAEQVHRSRRAPACALPPGAPGDSLAVTACEPGYPHCAIVATSPPYVESRYCVKIYQDECYPLFCNTTKTWKMTCPCKGDLCNGPITERETEAFEGLAKLVARTHNNVRISKRNKLPAKLHSDEEENRIHMDPTGVSDPQENIPEVNHDTAAGIHKVENNNSDQKNIIFESEDEIKSKKNEINQTKSYITNEVIEKEPTTMAQETFGSPKSTINTPKADIITEPATEEMAPFISVTKATEMPPVESLQQNITPMPTETPASNVQPNAHNNDKTVATTTEDSSGNTITTLIMEINRAPDSTTVAPNMTKRNFSFRTGSNIVLIILSWIISIVI